MKKISSLLNRYLNGLLGSLLSLLGFASCSSDDNNYQICMYGTPHSDFTVKGTVTDEDNAPVAGARVIVRYNIDGEWITEDYYDVATSDDGTYTYFSNYFVNSKEIDVRIVCQPEGGALSADSVERTVRFREPASESVWLMGEAEIFQNFTLGKKNTDEQ